MTTHEMERQFVEAAARVAYVMAWAEREEQTCVSCHRYIEDGTEQAQCATFADVSYTQRCHGSAFRGGQKLEDIAPPTPDYAREWAWKLLGALEEVNPRWGHNLPSICGAAARAHWAHLHRDDQIPNQTSDPGGWEEYRMAQLSDDDVVHFGNDVAMMALGTGVSWFDDYADFELHVPEWDAQGFELESVEGDD